GLLLFIKARISHADRDAILILHPGKDRDVVKTDENLFRPDGFLVFLLVSHFALALSRAGRLIAGAGFFAAVHVIALSIEPALFLLLVGRRGFAGFLHGRQGVLDAGRQLLGILSIFVEFIQLGAHHDRAIGLGNDAIAFQFLVLLALIRLGRQDHDRLHGCFDGQIEPLLFVKGFPLPGLTALHAEAGKLDAALNVGV